MVLKKLIYQNLNCMYCILEKIKLVKKSMKSYLNNFELSKTIN